MTLDTNFIIKCDYCRKPATSHDTKHLCQQCYELRALKRRAIEILNNNAKL